MIGDEALVPPTTVQPPPRAPESSIATPVPGSATADTSATVRPEQPASFCHAGLASHSEQPLPVPCASAGRPPPTLPHTVSLQPRALAAWTSDVPPTEVTNPEEAGQMVP